MQYRLTVSIRRRAILGSSLAALAIAAPAAAQTVDIPVSDVPQQDFDCDFNGFSNPTNVSTDCTVDGTRTVTFTGQTRQAQSPTTDRVTSTYDVTFSGNLQTDGVPVVTGMPFSFPFGGGLTDASIFFDPTAQTVNVDASYTAQTVQFVGSGAPTPPPPADPVLFGATNLTTQVNSIDVHADGNLSTADGGDYDYTLTSVDPAAVNGNSVDLQGTFAGASGSGAIQFGRLSGTAELVEGQVLTPYPDGFGAQNTGLVSNYALDYSVAATVTTNLDADGLTTPQVTVTDGIEMNGSRITNLGDGVAAGDAVNKGQLDAEANARLAADSTLQTAIDVEANTRAAADVALQGSIDAEAGTRAAADVALQTAIDSEASTRAAADVALQGSIDDEATTRAAADASLATAIGTEATARQTADMQIVDALNTENMTRAQADLQLGQRIGVQEAATATLTANLASEQAARMAADTALSTRLDAFGSRLDTVEAQLSVLDNRISSSTAVATAMSGNAFLPGMKFNLTANVATYDGAQAGSLQLGAMITDNIAINAGVATGFNRGGKTAARAGMTIGF